MIHFKAVFTPPSAVALVLLLLLAPATASAHGRLKGSTPAAGAHLGQVPRELRLDFSEAPDLTFSTIQLLGPDGREVALGAPGYPADSHRSIVVPIAAAMRPGSYTIVWQMAGDDGHPVRGRLEFLVAPGAMGIGAPIVMGGPTDGPMPGMHHDPVSMPEGNGFGADSALYAMVRWLQFVALLLVIGTVTFRTFVLARIHRDSPPDRATDESARAHDIEARVAAIGTCAAVVLAITLVARLAAQSYAMHGAARAFEPALVVPMIGRTMWGWGWLLELFGIGVTLAGFAQARDALRRRASRNANRWWLVAGVGAMLLAFSPGLSSHASAAPRLRALAMLADGVHVLAASSWLGTLSVLVASVLFVTKVPGTPPDGAHIRDLVNAFSPVALVSAGLVTATGVLAAWLHVGTIPNLWGTRYGIILLVKLAVLSLVAVTGLYNWRVVQPRLGSAAATDDLRRSACVEVGVAILVLLVTAVLVASPTSMDAAM